MTPRPLVTASLADVAPFSLGELSLQGRTTLAQRYGSRFLDAFTAWGERLGQEPATFRWVSNVQLFLAFCMQNDYPPPILRSGQWCNLDLLVNGSLVQVSTGQRIRWWPQVLRAFTRYSGTRWRSTETRPDSASLQVKLACYPLLISDAIHQRVETYIARHIPEGVVSKHSRAWTQCPSPNADLGCIASFGTSFLSAGGREAAAQTKGDKGCAGVWHLLWL